MGFFSGLITFQAVILLIVVSFIIGLSAGCLGMFYAIKERIPSIYEIIDKAIKDYQNEKSEGDTK